MARGRSNAGSAAAARATPRALARAVSAIARPSAMHGKSRLDLIPLLCVIFGTGVAAWALFGSVKTEAMSTRAVAHKRAVDENVVAVPRGAAEPVAKPLPLSLAANPSGHDVESLLVRTLLEVRENRLDSAMKQIEAVLAAYPNFRLANAIRGDLLVARARPVSTIGGGASGAPQRQLSDLRDEARQRLLRHLEEMPLDRVPKYLVQFQPGQKNAVVVDTSKSRLYLFENDNGLPRYVADFYVSSGKAGAEKNREGDQKTPLGVYFVTANLPKSQITDFYGVGAYPISYPNEWDRRLGKDGSGIWLHGVPSDTYSRPPRASNGCVVLANPDLDRIGKQLQIGLTPVIISENVEWIDPRDLASQRSAMNRNFEEWRRDWESVNTDKYLRHYSREFLAGRQDYNEWAQQKRQVNGQKSWIKVGVSNVSMFAYPGSDNVMVVTFDQDYSSNNLSNRMKKRQYWKLDGSEWKIVYEGAA